MLIIARVPQDRLADVAAAHGAEGWAGPTSGSGWTSLRSHLAAGLAGHLADADRVVVDDGSDGPRLLVLPADGPAVDGGPGDTATGPLELSWTRGSLRAGSVPTGSVPAAAARLAGWFGVRPAVRDLARGLRTEAVDDGDDLLAWLTESLDLPHVHDPRPVGMAVASAGAPDRPSVAATTGPTLRTRTADGWQVLSARQRFERSRPDPAGSQRLAADLSTSPDAASPDGGFAVLLHRDDAGAGAGVQVWRTGRPVAERYWHRSVRAVSRRPAGGDDFDRLVPALLGAPADGERFSALAADPGPAGDPLADFVTLFNLPGALLPALDDPAARTPRWAAGRRRGAGPVGPRRVTTAAGVTRTANGPATSAVPPATTSSAVR